MDGRGKRQTPTQAQEEAGRNGKIAASQSRLALCWRVLCLVENGAERGIKGFHQLTGGWWKGGMEPRECGWAE